MRTAATLVLSTVAAGGVFASFAPSASAAGNPPWEPDPSSAGGLSFYDSAGNQIAGGSINDSPIAAFVQGATTLRAGDTKATLFAYTPVAGTSPGTWSGEALSSSTPYPNSSAPGSLGTSTLPLVSGASGDETFATYISDFPNTDTSADGYAGLYQLRLKTSATGKPITTSYDSVDIQVTGNNWSIVYPAVAATPTTTTLTTTPGSPQEAGTTVTLHASVSPAVAGTVQFKDGSTNIGSPVTVTSGAASIDTSTLSVGTHSLHAVFSPTSAFYTGSTGDASFTVTAPPAAGTTTALSVNPTTAPAFTSVALTANVVKTSNSNPLGASDGSVKFFDNGTTLLGSANLDSSGTASINYAAFTVGSHSITAKFVPADAATYATSTSPAVPFTATQPTSTPHAQTVDVSIPAGSLTITTPYDTTNPFHLGNAQLDPKHSKFTASNAFGDNANPANGVSITDTRAGNQAWTASATVTDFTDGSSDVINGQNLTFTGLTVGYVQGDALQSGVTATDVTNSAIYAPSDSGSDGLKGGPHAFATTPHGDGSVFIDGLLKLVAPTSTPAGTYTATLTFTIA
ncbi:MAG: Ig-like domain repeat protein [Frankiaceae bacterium]|nr:Ig-like domain repeat protein [Frankiaceae bacterium]